MHVSFRSQQSGFTFVELIFVSAISVMIFGALFVSFQYTLELVAVSRSKLSALSLANDRMEYFRSLPYDSVGIVAGFPAGAVPQNSTSTLNGIEFAERVRIDYVDDPADNTLGVDDNDIITDYKQIRLEYTWELNGETRDLSLVSYIVPRSIETDEGGGTVRINVLDADSTPLPGASVQLFSSSSTFSYNVTNPTNADGAALFAVPADSGYQVSVTATIAGNQYSTAGTYVVTTANPNPVVAPFAVVEAGISTLTFQIGELSDLTITTLSDFVDDSELESFDTLTNIATSSNVTVAAGELVLEDTLGVYESSGTAFLDPIVPGSRVSWETLRVGAGVPADTEYVVQLYTGEPTAGYALIPDTDLPQNSSGFRDTLIDISALDVGDYPTTTVGITLTTTNTSLTPEVYEIEIFWRDSMTPRSGQSLYVRGDKIIGTNASSTSIYKATTTITTDGSGEVTLSDLEFDTYIATTTSSYDLATACPAHPFRHEAGVDGELLLHYVGNAANTLRAVITDSLGQAIPGVSVQLERSGYDVTQTTNTCGQTFFTGGLADETDYELTVSVPGYVTQIVDPFTVSGDTVTEITLSP